MDYKKMYEQAIKRAKAMILVAANQEEIYNSVITIFPELAENEDERVREALLEHIKGIKSWEYFLGISKEQMIAWLDKQGEQKPTWSEEDERLFQIIIDILDKEEHKGHLSHTDLIACVRKLKSLKDRVQPQPMQEWSEEDEKEYRRVEYAIMKVFGGDAYLIGWIRKFKNILLPQTTWKPSEEQMEALETAVSSLQSTALESLYNELKKL